MSLNLIWGRVENLEVKLTQKGSRYGRININRCVKTKDGQIKTWTNFVSVLDEYNLELIQQELLGKGDHVVLECNISLNSYTNKDGEEQSAINYVVTRIHNLDIDKRYNQMQTVNTQQPMMQQPMVQQPMMQQPMVQQPMMQQPMMQQPMVQVPQQQTPAGNATPKNPWEIDL